ncbi:AAA domain-containing protein [Kineosporia sp. NBRC 101731]|uniref:AAA domain-containing protein n=1 Tax=Kineosporia sp. NBRC 101731 TaxID=3032199 RepID=UPI0024A1869B|nr:AAA domain-containing protein [Kineosporia sp. NBRC 101731]GLY26763.1 very short patch repair endonuclease [Kineosporia sp. NBRC 101731]
MGERSEVVLDRTRRLLTFLAAAARELTVRPVRDVYQHDGPAPLLPSDIPRHPLVRLGPAEHRAGWLEVRKVPQPAEPPVPPAHLIRYVGNSRTDLPGSPTPIGEPNTRAVTDVPHLGPEAPPEAHAWLENIWHPWAETTAITRQARELYERLFTLQLEAERARTTHELVWGHCVLSWDVQGEKIRHPLLLTGALIELDAATGALRVLPDGPPELQLSPLEGLDLPVLGELNKLGQQVAAEPLDVWDPATRGQLHESLLAPLPLDASTTDGPGIADPTTVPVVTDTWVLFLRRRPTRHERFYLQLAERLRDDSVLPQALAAVVADNEELQSAQAELGQSPDDETWRPIGERLLMPLPANAEQERIARQLARERGVTVQGPPGTGKSHTIANLVSHLLAHGKRVLVTAQNEQALTVLRDKIPEELRDLSIAVLGSSSESMEQLRGSAQAVQDIASQIDVDFEAAAIVRLEAELDRVREQLRGIELAVLEALSTEDAEWELPSGPAKAPEVARWLTEHEPELGLIPDELPVDALSPLSPADLARLFDLSERLTPTDSHALRTARPRGDLPTPAQLVSLTSRLDQLRQDVADLEQSGVDVEALDRVAPEQLVQLRSMVDASTARLSALESPWLVKIRADVRHSAETAQTWAGRAEQLRRRTGTAAQLQRGLFGHEIQLPTGDTHEQRRLLHELGQRFAAGKGLPRFGGGDLKELHGQARIDGRALRTPEDTELALTQLELTDERAATRRMLAQLAQQAPVETPPDDHDFVHHSTILAEQLTQALAWETSELPALLDRLRPVVPQVGAALTSADLQALGRLLAAAGARPHERKVTAELETLASELRRGTEAPAASPLWNTLRTALDQRDWGSWGVTLDEVSRLAGLEPIAVRQRELADRLAVVAPGWAAAIVGTSADPEVVGLASQTAAVWHWRITATWLDALLRAGDLAHLQAQVITLQQREQALVLQRARRGAGLGLKRNLRDLNRRALASWLRALGKRGKGTGKYAPHWESEARRFMPSAMGAVPVWIMPVHRVIENFDPLVTEPFDVVIVDESSQCDLLSVGVLALGAKAVVVGDDQQTSPAAVGVNQERIIALQNSHLPDVGVKSLLTVDQSLYALSELIFPSTILLREHFRCVPEIIEFSNRYYDGDILPLREPSTAAIGAPLRLVRVADGATTGSSSGDKINRAEARALVEQVLACHHDDAYQGMTFGVVTLQGSAQAPLIENLLRDRLGPEAFAERRLRVGNPPAFQGDERNVVFISVVADDATWAATKNADKQRINVAASRAQEQLWVFHTVEPGRLHADDQRRALLEYVRDAGSRLPVTVGLEERVESDFELDVLRELLKAGYEVQVQHRVGRYRIDLVVVGQHARLAIECDGDRYHGADRWEADIRRQRQLERLGWTFWRIRASEFYRERAETVATLIERLDKHGVLPRARWEVPASTIAVVTAPIEDEAAPVDEVAPVEEWETVDLAEVDADTLFEMPERG